MTTRQSISGDYQHQEVGEHGPWRVPPAKRRVPGASLRLNAVSLAASPAIHKQSLIAGLTRQGRGHYRAGQTARRGEGWRRLLNGTAYLLCWDRTRQIAHRNEMNKTGNLVLKKQF